MIVSEVSSEYRVRVAVSIDVPLSASIVWGQMRDFAWFTTLDPFHAGVHVIEHSYHTGADIVIDHQFLGIRLQRVGRILKWTEGSGYCFSDLSKRGVRAGFPHVYRYEVQSVGDQASRINVSVRGRWTATISPRWLVNLWLRFVMSQVRARIRLAMLVFGRSSTEKRDRA